VVAGSLLARLGLAVLLGGGLLLRFRRTLD